MTGDVRRGHCDLRLQARRADQRRARSTTLNPVGSIYGWGYWLVWVLVGISAVLLVLWVRPCGATTRCSICACSGAAISRLSQVAMGCNPHSVRRPLSHSGVSATAAPAEPLTARHGPGAGADGLEYPGWHGGERQALPLVGVRASVIVGCALMALGCWRLASLDPLTGSGTLWPGLLALGFGTAFLMIPTQTLALQGLTGEPLNKATSLLMAGKLIFGAVGPAILVTVFDQQAVAHAHQAATKRAPRPSRVRCRASPPIFLPPRRWPSISVLKRGAAP